MKLLLKTTYHFSGALCFEDILRSGMKEDYKTLAKLENDIQMDDPVNIQFTSVSQFLFYM